MKKQFFTFLMMIALVIVAGKAMAQTNSKLTPAQGSKWTYTLGGMSSNNLDAVTFNVNESNTDFTAVIGTSSDVTIENASTAIASGSASVDVTWNVSSGTYYLWVKVQDNAGVGPTNCSNYRFLEINPIANSFVVTVYGMGTDDNDAYTNLSANSDNLTDCSEFVGADFDFNGGNSDGSSYVYFSVERTGGNASSTWSFIFTLTNSVGADLTSFDYYIGTAWTEAHAEASTITVPADQNTVIVRVLKANTAAGQTLTGNIGATAVETLGALADSSGANSKTITISTMPDLGGTGVTFD